MSRSSHRSIRVSLLVLVVAACAKDSPTSPATRLTFGEWGANHAQVVASGSATEVTYGCTSGEFAGNISLDVMGRFAVNGSFYPYAGPISVNGPMPAQFSGLVEGNTLTFAIAVSDTVEHRVISLGPQVVVLGQPANIVVCP